MVRFGLVRDEDGRAPVAGWPPPVDSEGLWAKPVGEGRHRIANTPWFVRDLATFDVVDAFADLGVRGESAAPAYPIVALDIPPEADFRAIRARLRTGRSDGTWDYEEACVSTEWRAG
jgi:hypothetical protein